MTTTEEPILSRLERLDNILKQLESMRTGSSNNRSPRSSCASSGTQTSDGRGSSTADFSPKSIGKHCRPIGDVMVETEVKGTLIERLVHAEERILKLCLQLEQGLVVVEEKTSNLERASPEREARNKKKKRKDGLKKLLKTCVKGSKTE